jgi:hypothetical protein
MRMRIDDALSLEVYFHPMLHEEGFEDDISFAVLESGPKDTRLFPADEIPFLLIPHRAERFAGALCNAAEESRNNPR